MGVVSSPPPPLSTCYAFIIYSERFHIYQEWSTQIVHDPQKYISSKQNAFIFIGIFKPKVSDPKCLLDAWWTRPTLSVMMSIIFSSLRSLLLRSEHHFKISFNKNLNFALKKRIYAFYIFKHFQIFILMYTLNRYFSFLLFRGNLSKMVVCF